MRSVLFFLGTAVSAALFAAPTVDNVRLTQPDAASPVTVTYDLKDDDGIVTFDVLTNGVSVGGENLLAVFGDINRKVAKGDDCSFSWRPSRTWPASGLKGGDATVAVTAWAKDAPPTYMVIDLGTGIKRFYPCKAQVPGGITDMAYKTDKLLMRKIPAAGVKWRMGSTAATDPNRQADRENYHWVTLKKDYYIAVYPITNKQQTYFPAKNTTWTYPGEADDLPVHTFSWSNARGSASVWPGGTPQSGTPLNNLATLSGITSFELPTEAQWEFACRAGNPAAHNAGTSVGDVAWYGETAPHPVGSPEKLPNAWDLYDMHGNIWEWCRDYYQATPYAVDSDVEDPEGPSSASPSGYRAWRGGSYKSANDTYLRSATRSGSPTYQAAGFPDSGYRPVCDAVIP